MNKCIKLFGKNFAKILLKIILATKLDLLINRNKLIILMYHGVTNEKNSLNSVENYDGKHVFAEKFEEQICFLKKRYNLISMQTLQNYINGDEKLPKNALVITFDDGYNNNYDTAFPILKRFKIPATIFVCSSLARKTTWPDKIEQLISNSKKQKIRIKINNFAIEFDITTNTNKINTIIQIKRLLMKLNSANRRTVIKKLEQETETKQTATRNYELMTWKEIKELSENNITIGSHTATHAILTTEDSETIEKELTKSKKIIENKTNQQTIAFAYPNGIFDDKLKAIVKNAGYSCAFTTKFGKNNKSSDKFELKRIPVTDNDNNTIFLLNLIFNVHKLLQWIR